jgi:hypothetical protein
MSKVKELIGKKVVIRKIGRKFPVYEGIVLDAFEANELMTEDNIVEYYFNGNETERLSVNSRFLHTFMLSVGEERIVGRKENGHLIVVSVNKPYWIELVR